MISEINSLYDALLERKAYLETLRREKQRQLAAAPPGTLRISKRRGYPQYYHRETSASRSGKYLGTDHSSVIRQLAQKSYDQKVLSAAEEELTAVCKLLSGCPAVLAEDIYDQLPESRRQLIDPLVIPFEEYAATWESRPFTSLGFADDTTELLTDKGERVRSKSEMIIADLLYRENLHYKYECPLALGNNFTVYPDFTILHPITRREIYWEHMGMMDDENYASSALKKLASYILAGHYPGEDLILTFETHSVPLNMRMLHAIVEHMLLQRI